jgi:hypothetical protein
LRVFNAAGPPVAAARHHRLTADRWTANTRAARDWDMPPETAAATRSRRVSRASCDKERASCGFIPWEYTDCRPVQAPGNKLPCETLYLVTDEQATYRTVAVVLLAVAGCGVAGALFEWWGAAPGPARTRAWRDALLPLLVALGAVTVGAALAFHPGWLAPLGPAARYEAGDYQTTEGLAEGVEREPGGHGKTVYIRFRVNGQTFRCTRPTGYARFDDRPAGSTEERVARFARLLDGKPVRVRHAGGQLLQLEVAAGR